MLESLLFNEMSKFVCITQIWVLILACFIARMCGAKAMHYWNTAEHITIILSASVHVMFDSMWSYSYSSLCEVDCCSTLRTLSLHNTADRSQFKVHILRKLICNSNKLNILFQSLYLPPEQANLIASWSVHMWYISRSRGCRIYTNHLLHWRSPRPSLAMDFFFQSIV